MSQRDALIAAKQYIEVALDEEPSKPVAAATGLIDKIKDNIAYVLGLPAAITGAFGFLWESSAEEAALTAQVAQLEEAVADLKAEGDLLGGGAKNWIRASRRSLC